MVKEEGASRSGVVERHVHPVTHYTLLVMTDALYHSLTGLHCLHVSASMRGFEELVSVKHQ